MKKSGMKMELHISPFKQVYRLMYVGNIWKDEYRGCYAQIVPQNGNQEVYKGTMILDISGDCTNRATITAKLRLVK